MGFLLSFKGFRFDVLAPDLLKVVEESRMSGKILVVFNTTLIALIRKSDSPMFFKDFRLSHYATASTRLLGKLFLL